MGEEIRSTTAESTVVPSSHSTRLQETLGMYQASKKELDELVATMDGL
jgi:hypothetical protein